MPPFAPRSVGHKALAVALSDLAAMGAGRARPTSSSAFRERLDDDELLELADGLGALAAEHRVAIAGGDVDPRAGAAPRGHRRRPSPRAEGAGAAHRAPAPATSLAVTGELGGAAAGLLLLERPELAGRSRARRSQTRCAGASSSPSRGSPPGGRSRTRARPR